MLYEATLFLHKVAATLPDAKLEILNKSYAKDSMLVGRKILIVDDDDRNIFALTSILETQNMNVVSAQNGLEALKLLADNTDIEIVLMDIMMSEMDGYETIKRIRQIDKFKALPVIALTAKAMKGDREKCIAAGASEYVTKPVNTARLKSLLRVWLHKGV